MKMQPARWPDMLQERYLALLHAQMDVIAAFGGNEKKSITRAVRAAVVQNRRMAQLTERYHKYLSTLARENHYASD